MPFNKFNMRKFVVVSDRFTPTQRQTKTESSSSLAHYAGGGASRIHYVNGEQNPATLIQPPN